MPWFRRLPPNTFGIAFGLAGLASMWRAMDQMVSQVGPIVPLLTVISVVVWVVLVVAYLIKISRPGALMADLDDPVLGPFVALAFIAGMVNGSLLYGLGAHAGRYLVLVCAILALVFGGWITGHWIVTPLKVETLHPGYFLPTVAGGLVGATALKSVGFPDFALIGFGIGMICWVIIGSIVTYRLFVGPPFPAALVPLLAIELAPPAVAGNAWTALVPGTNPVQWALIGYTLLMAMVQLRLYPEYRKVPFGPTFWAFAFSYSAAATYALHWLKLDPFPGGRSVAWVIILAVTGFVVWIAIRTVQSMRAGTYFPKPVPQPNAN